MFPLGFEPRTSRVWGERDNHYTTETYTYAAGHSIILLFCRPCYTYAVGHPFNKSTYFNLTLVGINKCGYHLRERAICEHIPPYSDWYRLHWPEHFVTNIVCWRYSRDRIVVSTSRCGRDNPGSNPGHGRGCEVSIRLGQLFVCPLYLIEVHAIAYSVLVPKVFWEQKQKGEK